MWSWCGQRNMHALAWALAWAHECHWPVAPGGTHNILPSQLFYCIVAYKRTHVDRVSSARDCALHPCTNCAKCSGLATALGTLWRTCTGTLSEQTHVYCFSRMVVIQTPISGGATEDMGPIISGFVDVECVYHPASRYMHIRCALQTHNATSLPMWDTPN